jgi:glycosyltransferase involved in cell wall biosynthesis
VLGRGLEQRGVSVSTAWWDPRVEDRETWLRRVEDAVRGRVIDWIVWHYSVFEYGGHGIPYDVPSIARRLRRLGPRMALVAHEYAFPFGRRGLRGTIHAVSQRAVLRPLLGRADAVLVTVDARRERLARFRKPIATQPVFSNLPPASSGHVDPGTIGVFGYGSEDFHADLTARAIAALDRDVRVILLGAPGPGTPAARRWHGAFAAAGRADALELTGILPPDEAARRLGSVEVVLFPDRWGPSSRKGTLAAALAAGAPVVALDGPERSEDLVAAEAVVLALPEPKAIATRVAELLDDDWRRRRQGRLGASFYEENLSPARAADTLLELLSSAEAR